MKPSNRGRNTPAVEVSHISARGFWLLIAEGEFFVDFDTNPWFGEATIAQILEVTMPHEGHLFWKTLDVDLEVESLMAPDKYPLIYK